jgi:alpha-ribazole phosphatase
VRLYLIRHPQPQVAPGICYGRSDLPLRAPWAVDGVVDQLPAGASIVSSPLRRCADFAAALAPAGQPVRIDARLTELDFGAWEMQAWDDIPRAQIDAWAVDPLGFDGHGGERVTQMQRRVGEALAELDHSDGQDQVWITHAGVMKLVCAELLTLPQDEWLALRFAYAELIVLALLPAQEAEQERVTPAGSRWSLQHLR